MCCYFSTNWEKQVGGEILEMVKHKKRILGFGLAAAGFSILALLVAGAAMGGDGGAADDRIADLSGIKDGSGDALTVSSVTSSINYQGRLTDSSGNPLSGTYAMTFKIYESSSGGTALATDTHSVSATNGLFSTTITVDPGYFDGRALWLGITVGNDPEMTPRQALRPVPYALSLRPGAMIKDDDSTEPVVSVVYQGPDPTGTALYAQSTGLGIEGVAGTLGVRGLGQVGVSGEGLTGVSGSGSQVGVWGDTGESDQATGVLGMSDGFGGTGVKGIADNYSGTGVSGHAMFGTGVFGTGEIGVRGNSTVGPGVQGEGSIGVSGSSQGGMGVSGGSANGVGVYGYSQAGTGVVAVSESGTGVDAMSTNDVAVYASAGTIPLILITGRQAVVAYGEDNGVVAWGGQNGVTAQGATGVYGSSVSQYGQGVYGHGSGLSTEGVLGTSDLAVGVYGISGGVGDELASGVWGHAQATSGFNLGVIGLTESPDGVGIRAKSTANPATNPTARILDATGPDGTEFKVQANGEVYADGSFHGGGADYADMFPISGKRADYEAGDVLVIGPDGQLIKSDKPCSTAVVGVYSTQPAFVGDLRGAREDDEMEPEADDNLIPVTLVGVVRVKATTGNGAIQPGDLLTTSSTPGHAMKASPVELGGVEIYRPGTIVGKAMEPLSSGTGLIEVYVTLQ